MVSLDGTYKAMSTTISDQDGGWWHVVGKGYGVHSHVEHVGRVIATVDIIIAEDSKLLLIKWGKEPFKNGWAFSGGRIEQKDTNIEVAAYRELREETSLSDVKLTYLKTIGNNIRDPRGFALTNVFIGTLPQIPDTGIKAGDDAIDYDWFELDDLPEMAFDHEEIIQSIKGAGSLQIS